MIHHTVRENVFVYYSTTILAWIAIALMALSIAMGDQILQQVVSLYPDFSLPAFFVPWFLLVITSVQQLQKQTAKLSLQLWVLKTTVPIFIFILPFFSAFLSRKEAVLNTADLLMNDPELLLGFEPYCLYVAIIVLFAVHFLPSHLDEK